MRAFTRRYLIWIGLCALIGILVFYYEEGDSLYKTVFPDDRHPDSLVFSEPVNVGEYTR